MMQPAMRDLPPVEAAANFPIPRLQVDTPGDVARFRTWEKEQLESYQVVDENLGTVRIPIARAMELTLQRGLPTRGATAVAAPARACLRSPGLDMPDQQQRKIRDLARRFAESGVRFIQVTHNDNKVQWDQHSDLKAARQLLRAAAYTYVAALIRSLVTIPGLGRLPRF